MRSVFQGFSLGLALAVAGMLALATNLGAELEEGVGLSWLFNARGPVVPPSEVIIVAMDEQSARQLGLPDKPRDWPRDLHAQLVRFLARAGARIVCFDLTFDRPGTDPAADEVFAAAVGAAGNVLMTDPLRTQTIWLRDANAKALGSANIEKPSPPIAGLEQAVAAHAPFLLPKGARVNAYWTFKSSAGDAPTLPVLAFSLYASAAIDDFVALLESPVGSDGTWRGDAHLSPAERNAHRVRDLRDAALARPDAADWVLRRLALRNDLPLERRQQIESLVSLYAFGEMSYLNFYGPSHTIATVPYAKVVEAAQAAASGRGNAADAAQFAGKAVFVGFSAMEGGGDSARDEYRTVYSEPSGKDISGVEIQATAFANALQRNQLSPARPDWQIALVGAWGLLLGIVCRRVRPAAAVATVALLVLAFGWAVYHQFADHAVWWPSIIPLGVQVPAALFGGMIVNYVETKREREAVKRAFGRFLPSTVVEQLARHVGPITAPNRVVFGACLATDAEKYTTLAEQTEPGQLGELMNAYYADLFVPVERSGGVVIDVVGDAMLAIWAGASSEAESRIAACDSALEILRSLDDASAAGRSALPTRLGLHAGEMLIGSFGASSHYEYRAVGDIVNTASRIQGLNKSLGTRLLASQVTVHGLNRFALRPMGSFLLAGKATPVSIVELLGRSDAVDREVLAMSNTFATALAAYSAGRWHEAAEGFAQVLLMAPEDGPARFYQAQCERLLPGPPEAGWTSTIRIDLK